MNRRSIPNVKGKLPDPYNIDRFRGMNNTDSPFSLSNGVGQVCKNFYFDRGKLYPRGGSLIWGGTPAPVNNDVGIGTFRIKSVDFVFTAHWKAGGFVEIWKIGSGTAVASKTGLTDSGASQTDVAFARFGDYPLCGNGYFTVYYHQVDNLWYNNSIAVYPNAAPTLAVGAAGLPNGSYQYMFAYQDPKRALAQGYPRGLAGPIVVVNQQINITVIVPPASGNTLIYRKGGTSTVWKLVGSTAGAAFTDNIADAALGAVMLDNNNPFPLCQLICEHKGRLLGARSQIDSLSGSAVIELDVLYISYDYQQWRCPLVTNTADPGDGARLQLNGIVAEEVTGLASMGDVAAVLTYNSLYLFTGDQPQTFNLSVMYNMGCVAQNSVAKVGGYLVWLDDQDVYAWNGQGDPIPISKPIRKTIREGSVLSDKLKARACVYQNRYYLKIGSTVLFCDFNASGVTEAGHEWEWGQITGWPADCYFAVTGSPGQVETIYCLDASTHKTSKLEQTNAYDGFSGGTTVIPVEFATQFFSAPANTDPNIPDNHPLRVSRIRRTRVFFEYHPSGGAISPVGQAEQFQVLNYDGKTPDTVKDTLTFADNGASNTSRIYTVDEIDNDPASDSEYHYLRVTGNIHKSTADAANQLKPVIHAIEIQMEVIRGRK